MAKSELSHDRVREILDYDPISGIFTWVALKKKKVKYGSRAGTIISTKCKRHEYRRIRVDGRAYAEHRLAFFWMTGRWPSALIDHIDRNGLNNIWSNLREADRSQNAANSVSKIKNKFGAKGVNYCSKTSKYRAKIKINQKIKNLGEFETIEEASEAYKSAALECFGDFARI